MHSREALFDAAQQALKPIDLQVGMQAALHQHAGAAKFNRLANLFVDGVEVEDVSLGRQLALQRPIEGAERAVLGAEVGVINVAVDDVGDNAFRMQLAAYRVGFHADADEVVGAEHFESLLSGERHDLN